MKKLRGHLYDRWRRTFGRHAIRDPRPIAVGSPYTFFIPSEDRLAAIEPGDLVKVLVVSIPPGRKYEGERLWLEVTDAFGDDIIGNLDNDPSDIPQLRSGDRIRFKRWHVIDYIWQDATKEARFPVVASKQRWERCLVDRQVWNGTARVGYLYREEPDMTREGDKYPDSGWRIRADVQQLSDDEYSNPVFDYIAIGKVLNMDDSWLHLIDAPVGSAYLRTPDTLEFEKTEFTADRGDGDAS